MEKREIPFSPPDITEAEIAEVANAMRSGWITTGPRVKEFERQIAERIGVNRAVCLNSQTACAETALRLLGIGAGDEVITCAYTYTASASIIAHVGAKIVLVDCQPDSYLIDYDAIEAAITPRTKAIIPIDLGGVPCDYDRLHDIAKRHRHEFQPTGAIQQAIGRIAICADTAHALGAKRGDKMVGTMADFSNFSFHAVKNLTTAEGGAMTWRPIPGISDEDIYHRVQLLSLHGQTKDALSKTKIGSWEYDIQELGYKNNMTDIAAAMGIVQLQRYDELLAKRKAINEAYDAALIPLGVEVVKHYTDAYTSTGHLYQVRVPGITAEQRNEIIHRMGQAGISCNVHYKPLPMFTVYRNLGFDIADYPNAHSRYLNEITLPNHTLLTDDDIAYVLHHFTTILSDYIPQ